MKGESLYRVWCEGLEKRGGVGIPWRHISADQQFAWNELASFMQDLIIRAGGGVIP